MIKVTTLLKKIEKEINLPSCMVNKKYHDKTSDFLLFYADCSMYFFSSVMEYKDCDQEIDINIVPLCKAAFTCNE